MTNYLFFLLVIACAANINGQSHPLVWHREQRSRTTTQSDASNDIYVNTDRLMMQLEQRVLTVLRNDINGIKQQINRMEETNVRMEEIMNQLKTNVDAINVEINQQQVFGHAPYDNNSLIVQKIDNVGLLLNAIRGTVAKIQRETSTTRKSLVSLRTQASPQNSLVNLRENDNHGHNTVCTSDDINTETGIRRIRTGLKQHIYALCDMDVDDGNWIVIQKRFDGSIDFVRGWNEYKNGFGNVGSEYWMGLENIYELTSSRLHELMIIMEHSNGSQAFAKYSAFAISNESNGYALNLLGDYYSGDAGDSLKYHAAMKFSTYDNDNDGWEDGNCARSHFGGWWYKACDESNLNGRYFNDQLESSNRYQGIYWSSFNGPMNSMKSVKMMIRPIE